MHIGIAQIKGAAEIASPRSLDLNHAGSHVRQPKGGQRTRKKLAEVQHQNAVERPFWFLIDAVCKDSSCGSGHERAPDRDKLNSISEIVISLGKLRSKLKEVAQHDRPECALNSTAFNFSEKPLPSSCP